MNERDFFDDQFAPEGFDLLMGSLKDGNYRYFDVSEYEEFIDYLNAGGDFERSELVITLALQTHPNANSLKIRFAQALLNRGEPEKARLELEALGSSPNEEPEFSLLMGNCYLMEENGPAASESFKKAIRNAGEELDDVLYQVGSSYVSAGEIQEAVNYFERSFEENPENDYVLNDLGYFYDQLGFPEKSIYYYNLYLDIDPFNPAVWFNLGIACNRLGQFEKALEAYDFTLALSDDFFHALFNKANSLANLERFKEAVVCYRDYLKYDPENDDALCYMGECYLNLGRRRMAERYYSKALKVNPANDMALFSSGIIAWMDRDYLLSIDLMKRALALEGNTAEYWFTYARVLADSGKEKEARAAFRKASSLNPGQSEIWMHFAEYLHGQGQMRDAIRILKKGIRHNNRDAAIKYLLAAYLYESDEEKEASMQLETALKLDFNRHDDLFKVYPKAAQNDSVKKLIKAHKPLK